MSNYEDSLEIAKQNTEANDENDCEAVLLSKFKNLLEIERFFSVKNYFFILDGGDDNEEDDDSDTEFEDEENSPLAETVKAVSDYHLIEEKRANLEKSLGICFIRGKYIVFVSNINLNLKVQKS